MKYLLVLLVIVVAANIWRHKRGARMGADAQASTRPGRSIAPPQDMVACAACGLHLPRADALSSSTARGRYFCCAEHRDASGER
ncbi:hypothetical protein GCM10010975_09330 [Comamonas phosphati]|nr:hypothetical protein GCM10010975_09330 [Comamonas phosphati]